MNAPKTNVLVAGCGYVGSALAAELVRDGHRVFGLKRDPSSLPDGVTPVRADLTDPATLRGLPHDIERVVYAVSPSGRTEDAYEAAYVTGLTNLLDALSSSGAPVKRVVLTSSTAVYGQDGGEWVDETSETEPTRFSGRILLRAERALLDGPFDGVAVRLSGIYGPGRTWLVRKVEAGEAIDFVLDCIDSPNHDSFRWAPTVLVEAADGAVARWDARADFTGPSPAPPTAEEQYAQALLMTNEFLYID